MKRQPEQWARLREVRDRLASVGVCVECHWQLASPNRLMCFACRRKYTLRQRRKINYQGNKRCGNCRRRGHDRRTCRSRKNADLRDS